MTSPTPPTLDEMIERMKHLVEIYGSWALADMLSDQGKKHAQIDIAIIETLQRLQDDGK